MPNTRGYRVPTIDDDPNVPVWNDRLAEDVAQDIDILEELSPKPQSGDPDVIFAITDEDGRRTWLESDPAGRPTPRSASIIVEEVSGPVAEAVEGSLGVQDQNTPVTGLAFAVVDEDGRRTDLELDEAGHLTDRVVDSLRERITAAEDDSVNTSGDSMTGGAAPGDPYPAHLANLTGWNVNNLGVGGETSTTIAARVGGRPMMATVAGGSIPASGGVTVTLASEDGLASPTPLKQQHAGVNPVQIGGVEGTLSLANSVYTFTRTTAGTAVALNVPAPVITQAMRDRRSGIAVMWWGTNDGTNDMTDVIARQRAYIDHLADPKPRWLVIGLTISSAAYRAPANVQFRRAYGRRFIDLGTYLASTAALADAGMTPTQADLDAIATGNVPPQLRVDPTHLNNAGNILVAKQVRDRIKEMGWM